MKEPFQSFQIFRKPNQLKKDQLKSVMKYVGEDKVCKSKLILGYFGEKQLLIAVYVLTVSLKKVREKI
jgi:ATP-dependent DNA helicase RecQ